MTQELFGSLPEVPDAIAVFLAGQEEREWTDGERQYLEIGLPCATP